MTSRTPTRLLAALLASMAAIATAQEPTAPAIRHVGMPVSFEANRGQKHADVRFSTRQPGYTAFFTDSEVVFSIRPPMCQGEELPTHREVLRMKFPGARADIGVEGRGDLPGRSHYLIGNREDNWVRDVPHSESVVYSDNFPGIDTVFHARTGTLEYDFVVDPHADATAIEITFEGADHLFIDAGGNLHIEVGELELVHRRPEIFQEHDGHRVPVDGHFVIDRESVRFDLDVYDHSRRLVIDPQVLYSTYLGGGMADIANDVALDASGNAYVTGATISDDFPVTTGAYEENRPGPAFNNAGFVAKINPTGKFLVYSTFFGGTDGLTSPSGIALDSFRRAAFTGRVQASDMPTVNAYQVDYGGSRDAFFAMLTPTGDDLVFSSYLGGTSEDEAHDIALDEDDNIYLTGWTDGNFPVKNEFDGEDGSAEAFAAKFESGGQNVVYATYISGDRVDIGRAIATDSSGNAYITGETNSLNAFPLKSELPGGNALNGGVFEDVFITMLDSSGSLLFSTYLGSGGPDSGHGIAVNDSGQIYVTGSASSAFPEDNAIVAGEPPVFVAKVEPGGVHYSSYVVTGTAGASGGGRDIALDPFENVYVTGVLSDAAGLTLPSTLATTQAGHGGMDDAFVMRISNNESDIDFATFLGGTAIDEGLGIAVDSAGEVTVVGSTFGSFPISSPGVLENIHQGEQDGFSASLTTSNAPRIPHLDYDEPVVLNLASPADDRLYRLPTYLGDEVLVSITDPNDANANSIFLKFDELATTSNFDLAGVVRDSADQAISIPYAVNGTAFLLVQADRVSGGSNTVTLLATRQTIVISSFSTNRIARGTTFTAYIRGAGFRDKTKFILQSESEDETVNGTNLSISPSFAHVEFTLPPLAETSNWGINGTNPSIGDRYRLDGVLEVIAAPDLGPLIALRVRGPDTHRLTHVGHFTIEYENIAPTEEPAPLLLVQAPKDAVVFLPSEPEFRTNQLLLFAKNPDGPAGRLPSQKSGSIEIAFEMNQRDLNTRKAVFRIFNFEPLASDYVNWDTVDTRTIFTPTEWENAVPGLTQLGARWIDYHENFAELATRIGLRGLDAASARRAFRLATQEALGRPAAAIRGQLFDALTGKAIVGAELAALENGTGGRHSSRTGDGGFFTIECLEAETSYELTVPGFTVEEPKLSTRAATGLLGVGTDTTIPQFVATSIGANSPIEGDRCDEGGLPSGALIPPIGIFTEYPGYRVTVGVAIDPNEKNGPEGDGPLHLISNTTSMDYTVYFQNRENAGGPAQEVEVVDTLPRELDFLTFQRGTLSFVIPSSDGDTTRLITTDLAGAKIPSSSGLPNESFGATVLIPDVRLDPESEYSDVLCELSYDVFDGTMRLCLSTRHPITGQKPPPQSLVDGFLPPSAEGHISFRLDLMPNLSDGVDISNDVTISFKAGGRIETQFERQYKNVIGGPLVPVTNCVPNDTILRPEREEENTQRLFTWEDPTGRAIEFAIYLWPGSDPANPPPRPALAVAKFPVPFFFPAPLDPGQLYFWQVVSRGDHDSVDGPICVFQVTPDSSAPPGPPVLTAPAQGLQDVELQPLFEWQPGSNATSHAITVWKSAASRATPDFSRPSLLGNAIGVSSAEALAPLTDYCWEVTALNSSGEPMTSTKGTFRTTSGIVLSGFIRGDADVSGVVDVTDALLHLQFLLLGTFDPTCLDATDSDDSGVSDITDSILTLTFLFLGGVVIPSPGPFGCGDDPTPDEGSPGNELGCLKFKRCK